MKLSFKIKAIILLSTIAILFFLGELGVRIHDVIKGHNFFSNYRDKLIINYSTANPIPFRTFGPKYYAEKNGKEYISSSHNELYTIHKPKNTFRVVCFGGSTTRNEWAYEKYKIHYPLVLQDLLQKEYPDKKIEVINVGYDAYSTPHFLILLELDVISWSPDLVIISENLNDISASYWVNFSFDYSNKYKLKSYNIPDYTKDFTTLNALFQWSSFYWFIKDKIDKINRGILEKEISNSKQINTYKESLGDEPPKISQYIFKRNLLTFYYISHNWGIPVLYASQPMKANAKESDYLPNKLDPKLFVNVTPSEKIAHHKFFNKIIKEVADSTGSYYLDNDSLLAGKVEYFIDAVHYSKLGIEKLANNYFDYLKSKKIIEKERDRNVKNINNF